MNLYFLINLITKIFGSTYNKLLDKMNKLIERYPFMKKIFCLH